MVIVDASVWIDYLRGDESPETQWLDKELTHQPLALTDLTLCEVLQGVRDDLQFLSVRNDLLQFHLFSTGGPELAVSAARNYLSLRKHGLSVRKTIDCIVATFCLEEGHELLHRDRDFDAFERVLGLKVIHP